MPPYKDYYSTLGVERSATPEDIKKAHRQNARKYHPDLNPGDKDAEAKFREVQEAYEVLSDPDKRARYDRLGPNWQAGTEYQPPPGWQEEDFAGRGDYGGPEDIFESVGGGGGAGFSDFFESLFRGRRGARGGPGYSMRGRDVEVEVPVTLEEAHHGTKRSLNLEVQEPCPECNGTGIKDKRPCPVCRGRGTRPAHRTLEVTIPAGVRAGSVLRLAGQGEASPTGQTGDLLVHIDLEPHPRFVLDENDNLLMELPVTPWEAVLGARVPVQTLDGEVQLTVPAGSQTGQHLRLRKQGLRRRDGSRGDLSARLKVMVPTRPSREERELFERLASVSSYNPR